MSESLIVSIVGWLIVIGLALYLRNSGERRQDDDAQVKKNESEIAKLVTAIDKIKDRQESMERQILTLDFPVKLLWAKAQGHAADALHHPEPRFKEMDDLLDKLSLKGLDRNGDILPMTEKDTARLKELLLHRSTDMSEDVTHYEREQAKIMPVLMDNKLIEEQKGTGKEPLNIELVGEAPEDEKES